MAWTLIETVLDSVQRLAAMGGCLCSKEVINIEGTNYRVRDRIGEGYVLNNVTLVQEGTGKCYGRYLKSC